MSLTAIIFIVVAVVLMAIVMRIGWKGREVDFIWRAPIGPAVGAASAELFDQIVPVLVKQGFKMIASAGHTTVFERRYVRGTSVLCAVFLFPVGLIMLLARGRETVTVIAANGTLELQGCCNKPLADWVGAVTRQVALSPTYVP